MAKIRSIHETSEQVSEQIEEGNKAAQEVEEAKQSVSSAHAQLQAAYADLEEANETDEDGNPKGDPSAARANVTAAQQMLDQAMQMQQAAQQKLTQINHQKKQTAADIEQYLEGEESNLEALNTLATKRFGANAANAAESLAARMNVGAQAHDRLMASMGLSGSSKQYAAASGAGGGLGSNLSHASGLHGSANSAGSSMAGTGASVAAGGDLRAGLTSSGKSVVLDDFTGKNTDRLAKTYDLIAVKDTIGLSKEETASIQRYTGSGYTNMNQLLEHGRLEGTRTEEEIHRCQQDIDNITNAVGRHHLAHDTVLHRGLDMHNIFGSDFDKYRSGEMSFQQLATRWTGAYIYNRPFVSTSVSPGVAEGFMKMHGANGGQIHFNMPQGTPAMAVKRNSQVPDEDEVLVQRGLLYQIDGIEEVPGSFGHSDLHVTATAIGVDTADNW